MGHYENARTLGRNGVPGRRCESFEYLLRIQGRYPPHGQIKSSEGAFSGTGTFEESGWEKDDESTIYGLLAKSQAGKESNFPAWMNWTGAVLYAFGEHYFYTNDRPWLQNAAPALVRGCNWIINERQATKQRDTQGQKVLHYGLLPAGQAYDQNFKNPTYYPCWTDSYSCHGLERAAEALAEIGHPEAQRLLKEAANYREDILEVMRRTRQTDPSLPPYPERLGRPPGWADFATGALAYVDTGFLGPHDPAFGQLEEYMKRNFNRGVLGLTGALRGDEDNTPPTPTTSATPRTSGIAPGCCGERWRKPCLPFIQCSPSAWIKKPYVRWSGLTSMTSVTRPFLCTPKDVQGSAELSGRD